MRTLTLFIKKKEEKNDDLTPSIEYYLMLLMYEFRTQMCWWAQRKRDWTLKWRCLIRLGLVVTTHQSFLLLTSELDLAGYSNLVFDAEGM